MLLQIAIAKEIRKEKIRQSPTHKPNGPINLYAGTYYDNVQNRSLYAT